MRLIDDENQDWSSLNQPLVKLHESSLTHEQINQPPKHVCLLAQLLNHIISCLFFLESNRI